MFKIGLGNSAVVASIDRSSVHCFTLDLREARPKLAPAFPRPQAVWCSVRLPVSFFLSYFWESYMCFLCVCVSQVKVVGAALS